MEVRNLLFGLLWPAFATVGAQNQNVLSEVNMFMGTADDYGQMAPGAAVPFGMIQVCPDSNPRQHPGYDFEVPSISGISINRLSGVGGSGCGGNVSILPDATGNEVRILKDTEKAMPGYYAAKLSNGVEIRLTATSHMAVQQYAFPAGASAQMVLNPSSSFDRVFGAGFHAIGTNQGMGEFHGANTCGRGRYHLFYRLFSNVPFRTDSLPGGKVRLDFGEPKEPVEIRIVASTGLPQELDRQDSAKVWKHPFGQIRKQASRQWKSILERVQIQGGTHDQRVMFYTSLYRTMHSPFQVTGQGFSSYLGTDGQAHQTPNHYYSSWSLWDTYRTKFPLITLMQPRRSSDIMQSLAMLYITGKQDWSTQQECVPTVRTEHAIATLLDAYRKGVFIPNLQQAYPGMVAEVGRLSLKSPDQVLEAASDFWALGQLAVELGFTDDAERWQQRGEQLFDSIWPGQFQHIDSTYTKMRGNGLYQGTRWQYRWGAPMFLDRMENMHGRKVLAKELVAFFEQKLYNQGNEPDIHVPFLFGRLGMPRKIGPVVHQQMLDSITHRYGGNDAYPQPFVGHAFRNAPRGYCPEMDEDDGTMSAWFVFSCMGLYPAVVGEPVYELFSPVFDAITLTLDQEGKRQAVITTKGRKTLSQTLKKVTWNGKRLKSFQLSHQQLMQGGELVFWY